MLRKVILSGPDANGVIVEGWVDCGAARGGDSFPGTKRKTKGTTGGRVPTVLPGQGYRRPDPRRQGR